MKVENTVSGGGPTTMLISWYCAAGQFALAGGQQVCGGHLHAAHQPVQARAVHGLPRGLLLPRGLRRAQPLRPRLVQQRKQGAGPAVRGVHGTSPPPALDRPCYPILRRAYRSFVILFAV